MRLVSLPASLWMSTLLVLFFIPLAGLQTVVTLRAPWWNLPVKPIQIWIIASALILFPVSIWILFGKKWAHQLLGVLIVTWVIISSSIAVVSQNFWLGIFVLVTTLYWWMTWNFIRNELNRSYLNPQMKWFQSYPEPLHLFCRVTPIVEGARSESVVYRVARIDEDGVFVFLKKPPIQPQVQVRKSNRFQLEFTLGNRKVVLVGRPVAVLDRQMGMGLKFDGESPDQKKVLGDFVALIRGGGYVA
ncbi:MAG: hypothetical protein CL678_11435 [Bdellovibrionaceae bacterium]|nr:hypothetical protein [Pseudobdellovibrionaceae bacterium]|tara:strand:+ start:2074 stop:2808 length:735 start_codon:yes stop_codon:yes gene_type:complete